MKLNSVFKVSRNLKRLSILLSGIALFLAMGITIAQADPSPLGLEIGKATIEDAKKAFTTKYEGMNQYSLGTMLSVSGEQTGIDGAREATLIFNVLNKLVGVLIDLPKHRFDSLYNALSSKYRVTSREIPFVGNKKVVMRDGHTEITLTAPHMSFDMSLNYLEDRFYQSYKEQQQQQEHAKKQREASQL